MSDSIHQPTASDSKIDDQDYDSYPVPPDQDSQEGYQETKFDGDDEGDLEIAGNTNVVIEKVDRSLSEFQRWHQQGRLIIDPEWQRNHVWNDKRSSKLIESFLLDIPVPVIYLAKNDIGNYEVIDGLQRLTAVFNFFDNKYALSGTEMLKDYEKKKFYQLPIHIQNKLLDVTLRSFELSPRTSKDLLFAIFERLNTGGVALNRMEIRNCIYRGSLNSLIKELASNEDFIRCINQSGIDKRMKDREAVLRYLAFYERTYKKCKKGLGSFLNEFYDIYQDIDENKLKELRAAFIKSMRAAVTIFGDHGFRLRSRSGGWGSRINVAVFQSISVPLADYDLAQLTRRADAIYEEYLDLIAVDKEWVNCVTSQTSKSQNIQYTFEQWSRRLQAAIGDEQPNDKARLFSKSLKNEIFQQSGTCTICQQEIKLLEDAVLDHEEHYWRGGKTIPQNARLAHRHCNLTRSHNE